MTPLTNSNVGSSLPSVPRRKAGAPEVEVTVDGANRADPQRGPTNPVAELDKAGIRN